MKWGLSLSVLSFFILMTVGTLAASDKKTSCIITLTGEVDANTPARLESMYNALNDRKPEQCKGVLINIKSSGGDIEAAIKAGEFVRQKKMWTYVGRANDPNSVCASACVLVFLGGVHRTVWGYGKIGLHRPFSEGLSSSEAVSKVSYEKTNQRIRQYLNSMNIPPEALLNAMNAVSPGKVKWLTNPDDNDKLKELHITGEDPVYQDQVDSAYAKRLGISKRELYLREQRRDAICDSSDDDSKLYIRCSEDVMHGRR